MKKLLLLLPLIGAFALAGCGGDEEESGGGDHLDYSAEEVQAKVKELGETRGYEITYEVKSSDSETEHYTLGAKDHYYWAFDGDDKYMYHYENDLYQGFSYNSETSEFEKTGVEIDVSTMPEYKESMDAASAGFSLYLYAGNSYTQGDGLTKKGSVTFIGRSATKYEYKWAALQGSASYELIIDDETGVTLKWAIAAQSNVSGDSGSASIEAKSFKVGSEVEVPAHEPLKK